MNSTESKKIASKPTHCLNCGTELKGDFCYKCGQKNKSFQISFKQLISEFLGDYLTFDSKFFRSLKPLLFNPGFLTNEYITGRRVRYIFPLRLYLFVSLIFFFILAVNPHQAKIVSFSDDPVYVKDSTATADSSMENINNKIIYHKNKSKKDSTKKGELSDSSTTQLDPEVKILTEKLAKASQKEEQVRKKIFNYLPKMFFFMMPVFALILKLLYIRRKIFYMNHFIFALHFHTFTFITFGLLFIILGFFENPESATMPGIVVFINSFYLIVALKNVYRQSLLKSIVKFVLLSFSYLIVMAVSMLSLVGIAFMLLK